MCECELFTLLPEDGPGVEGRSTKEVKEKAVRASLPFKRPKATHRALKPSENQEQVVVNEHRRTCCWKRSRGASGLVALARRIMCPDEALALRVVRRFALHQIPALRASVSGALPPARTLQFSDTTAMLWREPWKEWS
jgi:hypothetical protein